MLSGTPFIAFLNLFVTYPASEYNKPRCYLSFDATFYSENSLISN